VFIGSLTVLRYGDEITYAALRTFYKKWGRSAKYEKWRNNRNGSLPYTMLRLIGRTVKQCLMRMTVRWQSGLWHEVNLPEKSDLPLIPAKFDCNCKLGRTDTTDATKHRLAMRGGVMDRFNSTFKKPGNFRNTIRHGDLS
jgi:hypothetical protein